MRGLHINPMTKNSAHGSTRIVVDSKEFNRAMDKAQKDIAKAMEVASGDALAYAKRLTENYVRGYAGVFPQAKKVANSLDYDKRNNRKAVILVSKKDNVALTARAIHNTNAGVIN